MMLYRIICLVIGYFCGCISSGYFVGKLYHMDIRTKGSGNAGTTNVLRTLGKLPALITFVGDLAKAIVPIVIIRCLFQADVIAFATPVYYFEMSGQMKTLLDRSNPLYTSDYAFRDIYLLASAAENDDSAVDGPINGLKGWIACFEKCAFKGAVRGVGATAPGDIRQHTAVLEAAYKMGRQA